MITKDQAMALSYRDEVHYTGKHDCIRNVGPRGGVTEKITTCRVSDACKTWKRSPERFHVPVKYGLYESGYIDNHNCVDWHLASECPLNKI